MSSLVNITTCFILAHIVVSRTTAFVIQTVCIESRGSLGGTCLNVGCIPSKALLHSSHLYEHAKHDFKTHGIKVDGLSFDLGAMMKNKVKAVNGLTGGIEYLLKKNKVCMHARFCVPSVAAVKDAAFALESFPSFSSACINISPFSSFSFSFSFSSCFCYAHSCLFLFIVLSTPVRLTT